MSVTSAGPKLTSFQLKLNINHSLTKLESRPVIRHPSIIHYISAYAVLRCKLDVHTGRALGSSFHVLCKATFPHPWFLL